MRTQFLSFFKFYLILSALFLSCSAMANQKCLSAFQVQENKDFTQPEVLSQYIDHTLLKQNASLKHIQQLAEEAIAYKLKAICVNSCRVSDVRSYLLSASYSANNESELHKPVIAATIGFPLGASSTEAKVQEIRQAITDGAQELDVVINVGAVKDKNLDFIIKEMRSIKALINNYPVKAILETDLLTTNQIIAVSTAVVDGGADVVKTSSGFVPNGKGATMENIELIKKGILKAKNNQKNNKNTGIKASGGIKTLDQAELFLKQGVTRLGTSSALPILKEAMKKHNIKAPKVKLIR